MLRVTDRPQHQRATLIATRSVLLCFSLSLGALPVLNNAIAQFRRLPHNFEPPGPFPATVAPPPGEFAPAPLPLEAPVAPEAPPTPNDGLDQSPAPMPASDTDPLFLGLFRNFDERFASDDIEYIHASEQFAVGNPYEETLHLHSIEVHIADYAVDERPVLLFVLCPFLDTFVVDVHNLGWGPSKPFSLSLCNPHHTTGDRQQKILDLLDIDKPLHSLPEVNTRLITVFTLGKECLPFQFASTSEFNLRRLEPPTRLSMISRGTSTALSETGTLVAGLKKGSRAQYSGTATFPAESIDHNGIHEKKPYLARRLQRFTLSDQGKLLSRGLDGGVHGALLEAWGLAFGNAVHKPVAEQRAGAAVGVTFDIGDGQQNVFTEPLSVDVASNEETFFTLDLITAKSATFRAEAICTFSIGNGPPQQYRLLPQEIYKTRVPNIASLSLDDAGTDAFVKAATDVLPDLKDRALAILGHFNGLGPDAQTDKLFDYHNAWQLPDALMVASADNRDAARRAVGRTIDVISDIAIARAGKPRSEVDVDCCLHECMPVVAKMRPDRAAEAAVKQLVTGDDRRLITACLAIDESREALAKHRDEIEEYLAQRPALGDFEFALAGALKLRTYALPLTSSIKGQHFGRRDVLYWAALTIGDRRADAAVLAKLASDKSDASEAAKIIDTMVVLGRSEFGQRVVAYIESVRERSGYEDGLRAALRYLQRFPTDAAQASLRSLSRYPGDGQIRQRASELLKKR